jgi:ATP-dependent Clp protease ATP-binding subunit ClpA
MFERFTARARRVVVHAQEEARELNHNYIGTEHLLLGLLREEESVAARVLAELEISLAEVRAQVAEIVGVGQQAPSGHIPFTPRAKKVLELSLREALQLSHNYIGTEHILLGLIREGDGVAAQVLKRLGGKLSRVRDKVLELVPAGPAESMEVRQIRTAVPGPVLDGIIRRLDAIAERLGAIERQLRLAGPAAPAPETAADEADEAGSGGSAGGEAPPAGETGTGD